MATYVNDLRLKEISTGDESGTWGTSTNTNLELIGEALGYATEQSFGSDADATTTVADGVSDPARAMYFKVTSAGNLTATRTLTIAPNTVSRVMFIENATSGSQSIAISQGSGANVTIATGKTAIVYLDGAGSGAAVVDAMAGVDPGVTDTLAEVLTAGNTTTTNQKIQFRDSAIYINSSADGQLDIVADTEVQIAATTVDINGNVDISGTTVSAGKITADAGIDIDNINIDGTTIALSSGSLTVSSADDFIVDAEGDINLDANGGDIRFKDNGTTIGEFTQTSNNFVIKSAISNQDLLFKGNDNGSEITALSFDMSEAGAATFNAGIDVTGTVVSDGLTVDGNAVINNGTNATLQLQATGGNAYQLRTDVNDVFIYNATGARPLAKFAFGGDVSFYEDTGTTPKMFWDASTERLGIGTTSPASLLTIQDATPVFEIDSTTSSNTATIQFTSSGTVDSKITHVGNTGVMTIDSGRNSSWGGKIAFVTDTVERMRIDNSGNVTVQAAGELRIRDDGTFIKEDQGLQIGNTSGTGTTRPIRFFTESAERMRIDSSGNVGIGTGGDNPTALLEVEAASNPEISIASSGGATSNFLNFKAISHSQQIQTQLKTVDNGDFTSDLAFLFKASGTSGALGEKARLTADGNLLVGTSSDTNTGKVRIQGATSSGGDSTVLTLHQGNFANGGASLIKIGTESGNFAKSAIGFKRTDDYDRGAIIFCQENTGDQSDVDSSDEVMRIDQTGKVGIGVTSMSHPLVIQNATPIIQLIDSNATTRVANIGGENGNVTIDIDPNQAEGTSYFSVDIDNTERMRIDSSGNVGIGTSSPSSYNSGGNRLVVGSGSGFQGITIASGSAQSGNLYFADGTTGDETYRGHITYDHSDDHMHFKTAGTERMRIDSSGQLLIGCTGQTGDAPNSDGFLFQQIGNVKIRVNSDGQACQQYYSPTGGTSSPVGSITVNASSTAFNTSSDQRLKENIADADDAGSKVDAIQVRQFDWIADGSHQDFGMVAQELQTVAPEAVTGDADSDEMMGVDYSKLVPMLVKEIQSLRARVQQLEND